jgi:hypothetical protein
MPAGGIILMTIPLSFDWNDMVDNVGVTSHIPLPVRIRGMMLIKKG